MNSKNFIIKKQGHWNHNNKQIPVYIIESSIDFELEFKKFECLDVANEKPILNTNGKQYLLLYGDFKEFENSPFFDGSVKFIGLDIEEAIENSKRYWGPIIWDNN